MKHPTHMTKTITLMGREYNMAINFGSLIAYERITGKNALDTTEFADGRIEPLLTLGYAMLTACNDEAPEMDALLKVDNQQEIGAMLQAVSELYINWLRPGADDKPSDKEDAPKND